MVHTLSLSKLQSTGFDRIKEAFESNLLHFVEVEVQLAFTFCCVAKTFEAEKRARNLGNAQKAYQAALKLFDRYNQPNDKWGRLKRALLDLERELSATENRTKVAG